MSLSKDKLATVKCYECGFEIKMAVLCRKCSNKVMDKQ